MQFSVIKTFLVNLYFDFLFSTPYWIAKTITTNFHYPDNLTYLKKACKLT